MPKFDVNSMPKFEEFTYWFQRTPDSTCGIESEDARWCIGPKEKFLQDPKAVNDTTFYRISEFCIGADPDIQEDFNKFRKRPEYILGQKVALDIQNPKKNDADYMQSTYEKLIFAVTMSRFFEAGRNPDEGISTAVTLTDWLESTDFFVCPGSSRFHDAHENGLLFHSLNVYNNILQLRKVDKFSAVNIASATLIALTHDFTKIGNYETYMRNVKDEVTGRWESVPAYRWKCNPFPLGHGVASMYLVSQFFKLAFDECLAIRWHMAEYRVAPQEVGELEAACEKYPLVRMIQFADQLACVSY